MTALHPVSHVSHTGYHEVIDGHARLPAGESCDWLLATLDRCGIHRAVVTAGSVVTLKQLATQLATGSYSTADPDNANVLRAFREQPERIIPFYFGNPHRAPTDYARDGHEFFGLEISPAVHGIALTDARVGSWLDVAAQYGHPVYTVCVPRDGARVSDLVSIARVHLGTTFILGHCGIGPLDIGAITEVDAVPNILVESSCTLFAVLLQAIEVLGAERVLFGSEFPHQHPAAELAKLAALDLSQSEHSWVAGRTIAQALPTRQDKPETIG